MQQASTLIAIGLACNPRILLADEPTTALDVTIQAQIVALMRRINQEHGAAIILVTHDLGLAAEFCDHIAVMYAGRIVEIGGTDQVIDSPQHPYTQGLLPLHSRLEPAPPASADRRFRARSGRPAAGLRVCPALSRGGTGVQQQLLPIAAHRRKWQQSRPSQRRSAYGALSAVDRISRCHMMSDPSSTQVVQRDGAYDASRQPETTDNEQGAPLVAASGLTKHFPIRPSLLARVLAQTAGKDRARRRWRRPGHPTWRNSGPGRRKRLRQDDVGAHAYAAAHADSRRDPFSGQSPGWPAGIVIGDDGRPRQVPYYHLTQIVFQNPYSSLNPRKTVREILTVPLRARGLKSTGEIEAEVQFLVGASG